MLQIQVTGHQWWWEFRYPDLGIITANELHIPVGQQIDVSDRWAIVAYVRALQLSRNATLDDVPADVRPTLTGQTTGD